MQKRFLGVVLLALATSTHAGENCDFPKPPKASAINLNHGELFFVYPRDVASSYSGCQTMWDEHGQIWFVLRFDNGRLEEYTGTIPAQSNVRVHCVYRDSAMVPAESGTDCPSFDRLKSGIPSIRQDLEPQIPPERDPRKR